MSNLIDKHAVLEYLHGAGWKVSQRSLYNHIERGYLCANPDGSFSQGQVDTYAAARLKKSDGSAGANKTDKLTDLTINVQKETHRKLKLQNEKTELELKAQRESWIKREDLERELAGRAGVLDAGLRHFFYSKAPEIIALVGGGSDKVNDLIDFLGLELDKQLTEFATTDRFQVVVTDGS